MSEGFQSPEARLNKLQKLEFLQGDSAQDLLDKLRKITLPTILVSFYTQGTKHYCWFYTEAKLIKKKGV